MAGTTDFRGVIVLGAGTAEIGKLAAGTAEIGKLGAGTASIGTVILGAGTAEIGKLAAGTASIGTVILGAGTAEIGKLAAGTAEIGKLAAGTAAIGSVTIGARTGTSYAIWEAITKTTNDTGAQTDMTPFDAFTLYLLATANTNFKIELSPDAGGSPTYYELEESPIALTANDPKLVRVGFHTKALRVTTSAPADVTCIILGVA